MGSDKVDTTFSKWIIYIIFPHSLILLGESLDLED